METFSFSSGELSSQVRTRTRLFCQTSAQTQSHNFYWLENFTDRSCGEVRVQLELNSSVRKMKTERDRRAAADQPGGARHEDVRDVPADLRRNQRSQSSDWMFHIQMSQEEEKTRRLREESGAHRRVSGAEEEKSWTWMLEDSHVFTAAAAGPPAGSFSPRTGSQKTVRIRLDQVFKVQRNKIQSAQRPRVKVSKSLERDGATEGERGRETDRGGGMKREGEREMLGCVRFTDPDSPAAAGGVELSQSERSEAKRSRAGTKHFRSGWQNKMWQFEVKNQKTCRWV